MSDRPHKIDNTTLGVTYSGRKKVDHYRGNLTPTVGENGALHIKNNARTIAVYAPGEWISAIPELEEIDND